MMDLEQLHVRSGELARAAPADPRVHLERQLAVASRSLVTRAPRIVHNPVAAGIVTTCFLRRHDPIPPKSQRYDTGSGVKFSWKRHYRLDFDQESRIRQARHHQKRACGRIPLEELPANQADGLAVLDVG